MLTRMLTREIMPAGGADVGMADDADTAGASMGPGIISALGGKNAGERAKWIPLRVSGAERMYLKLLEGALDVSLHCDKCDDDDDDDDGSICHRSPCQCRRTKTWAAQCTSSK